MEQREIDQMNGYRNRVLHGGIGSLTLGEVEALISLQDQRIRQLERTLASQPASDSTTKKKFITGSGAGEGAF